MNDARQKQLNEFLKLCQTYWLLIAISGTSIFIVLTKIMVPSKNLGAAIVLMQNSLVMANAKVAVRIIGSGLGDFNQDRILKERAFVIPKLDYYGVILDTLILTCSVLTVLTAFRGYYAFYCDLPAITILTATLYWIVVSALSEIENYKRELFYLMLFSMTPLIVGIYYTYWHILGLSVVVKVQLFFVSVGFLLILDRCLYLLGIALRSGLRFRSNFVNSLLL
ncbi:MAG: hypothetical protein VCB26_14540 [Candidatus Hydrogenedentota bacterium]